MSGEDDGTDQPKNLNFLNSTKKLLKIFEKEEKFENLSEKNRKFPLVEEGYENWPIKSIVKSCASGMKKKFSKNFQNFFKKKIRKKHIFTYFSIQSPKNYTQNCQKFLPNNSNLQNFQTYMSTNKSKNGWRINVDKTSKNYYCLPPKTGTSNFGYLIAAIKLRVSTSKIKIFVPNNHQFTFVPYISFYARKRGQSDQNDENDDSAVAWEQQATGLLLTRHPLTRLYSSWANRFSDKNPVLVKAYQRHVDLINSEFREEGDPEVLKHMRVTLGLGFF